MSKKFQSLIYSELKLFCEVAQLQKISKNVKFFLAFFQNRLKKNSRVVQKIFSYKNFVKVMIKYSNIVNNKKAIEKLEFQLFDVLSDPCFLFMVYSNLRKDIINKSNDVGKCEFLKI